MDPYEDLQAFMEDHSEARALGQRLLEDRQALLDAFERSGGQVMDIQTETGEHFCTCYFDRDLMDQFRAAIGETDNWERDLSDFVREAIIRGAQVEGHLPAVDEVSEDEESPAGDPPPNEG